MSAEPERHHRQVEAAQVAAHQRQQGAEQGAEHEGDGDAEPRRVMGDEARHGAAAER